MATKEAEQFVLPDIVGTQQVTGLVGTRVGGGQTANVIPGCPLHAMMGTDFQRTELIHTDYPPAPRFRLSIATLDRFFLVA